MSIIWDNISFTDYIHVDKSEINNLPAGMGVSTMCASCKLNTLVNIVNIEKYFQLNPDDILTVKMNKERLRTIILTKKKPKRQRKNDNKLIHKDTTKNYFYNQITVVMRIDSGPCQDLNDAPKINIKLFKNGSVQMSGCKSVKNINIVLNKLIYKLKEIKAIMDDGKLNIIEFIDEPDKITILNFKIDMINSNYKVNMQIDRDKLYNLLLKKKIKSSYEPCIRACVIIKFTPCEQNSEFKEVSIFVFQKGNIIITGARSRSHIISSYEYMNNILLTHTDEIIKKDDNVLDLYNLYINEL
jgi:TATA-box binding protein (TBP) (component of TFIID and TFIIIB)